MFYDVVRYQRGRMHGRDSRHAREPSEDRMRLQNTVRAHKAFGLAFVDVLNNRQRASVVFVVGHTSRHEHVGIKEILHFLRSFPVAAEILPSRSSSMRSRTRVVVIGFAKSPVKTSTLPSRTN